ncbi:MAG: bile acid:sodium symporter [Rubrivivax sp.]|jgi:BASS family bile acid:Na+ symporter|nr:bile acid:sodium symporter [Betaproteobacteria bacterium]MBP6320430.1 bile acid:sodium symporter [Rubrivivax sp.]MBK7516131.1 bile acid:sodium symporter [Betaproteobacteria bacterium]MBK8108048.1 bile acid:sodium symporter [Betaproteobacteria bacterium]MBK8864827.1 bile acid:sodium symporter [Betaproteobacteria bacterium]
MNAETLNALLKISLVIFMAGNLLDMGLRLKLGTALVGLRNMRFVSFSLLWCFVLGPAVAWGITQVIPLEPPYAMGLILIGLAPCAPFLPAMVDRARGDLGYTASFMLLASVGMVAYMPLAVPLLVQGLSVSAWVVAKPLLAVVLVPLVIGMVTLRRAPGFAARAQPVVKKITGLVTIIMLVLCLVVYGEAFIGSAGSYATLAQVIFYCAVTAGSYMLAFGLPQNRRSVLALGVCTRNLGAAFAPLFAVAGIDERAIVMVALGVPLQTIAAVVAARVFGSRAEAAGA